jgi:hypothetical protein
LSRNNQPALAQADPASRSASDFQASKPLPEDALEWQATVSQAYGQSKTPGASAASSPSSNRLQGTEASGQAQARVAISLMSDFVSSYFPEQAMELILEIEQLDTPEQLLASLKGYESFIAPVGASAARHLDQVRATLSDA